MADHGWSPEPWHVEQGRTYDIETETGTTVVWGHDDYSEPTMSEEDARRIVAAVNAVAGIPTEALEAGALGKALDCFEEMATQHRCRCEHPACNRCADDAENAAALRSLGRTP